VEGCHSNQTWRTVALLARLGAGCHQVLFGTPSDTRNQSRRPHHLWLLLLRVMAEENSSKSPPPPVTPFVTETWTRQPPHSLNFLVAEVAFVPSNAAVFLFRVEGTAQRFGGPPAGLPTCRPRFGSQCTKVYPLQRHEGEDKMFCSQDSKPRGRRLGLTSFCSTGLDAYMADECIHGRLMDPWPMHA
jgi:hypothetical protein